MTTGFRVRCVYQSLHSGTFETSCFGRGKGGPAGDRTQFPRFRVGCFAKKLQAHFLHSAMGNRRGWITNTVPLRLRPAIPGYSNGCLVIRQMAFYSQPDILSEHLPPSGALGSGNHLSLIVVAYLLLKNAERTA